MTRLIAGMGVGGDFQDRSIVGIADPETDDEVERPEEIPAGSAGLAANGGGVALAVRWQPRSP
jgi:hypothetical protein